MMATAQYLFEAPPSHAELPDRSYRRALLDPEAGPLLEAFAWEDAAADHAEGRTTAAETARRWWRRLLRPAFAARLGSPKWADVHHAIELQVLDRYPKVFSPRELNSFRNMRGVPREVTQADFARRPNVVFAELAKRGIQPNTPQWDAAVRSWRRHESDRRRPKQFHNSGVRDWWDRQYTALDAAIASDPRLVPNTDPWRRFVRRYLLDSRASLDKMTKGMFTEHRKGLDFTKTGQGIRENIRSYVDPATGIAYRKVDPATGLPYPPFDVATYLARRRK
jgi:hypothetical protein